MANPSPFATNAHGVQSASLDFDASGSPTTMSYHGLCIVVNNNIVGRIQSWHPEGAYNRDGEHVYELSKQTIGKPIDYVPGKITGLTISFARTEVWGQEFELALGFSNVFADLTDQTRPFTIQEFLFKGTNPYRIWQYSGGWLKSKNSEAWESQGNYIYRISGQIAYVSRTQVL